jgi:hypothetical protein
LSLWQIFFDTKSKNPTLLSPLAPIAKIVSLTGKEHILVLGGWLREDRGIKVTSVVRFVQGREKRRRPVSTTAKTLSGASGRWRGKGRGEGGG